MTKTTEPLPKFEDWTPPWGEDDENFDAEKAKKLIYGLTSDKGKLGKDKADLQAKVTEVEGERDGHKAELDKIARKDETEVDRLKRELEESKSKPPAKAGESDLEVLRLSVALDKGLTRKQAARLVGTTEAELAEDADAYLADLKPSGKSKTEDDDDDDDARSTPRRNPRARSTNRTDPDPSEGGPMSTDQALELIPRP
jgi:hypothetical protein